MTEADELRKIRVRLAALGNAPQWFLAADGDATFVEARGAHGELNEIARFHRGASPDEIDFIVNAPSTAIFLLRLVDRAIAAARKSQGAPRAREPKDFAAEAAMKCEDPAFRDYLEQRHGLERPKTTDRVAHKLRSVLCVSSRKELNNDAAAADRWRNLRADYEAWRKATR